MAENTYNVGIYCRLSNDDERDGESVSIENQKLLLQRYVRDRGWNEIDTYIDDGYSGTNFQRPGVQRLIEDAKAGQINVILVKDLSRFGRNYIEFGQQRELLSKFAMLNGWVETRTYIDDGYSGGNFQRPGFLEMLEDARKGVINLILVKDLSRLGRDYVEVGRYTDAVFPSLGCRFVSVLDCLDSEGGNTDMLHFRALINDYHLRDLSSKIKSVLHFNDADEIDGYALEALRWAVENGIINGYGDGRLGPQGLATWRKWRKCL